MNVHFRRRVSPIATIGDPMDLSPACLGVRCLSAPLGRFTTAVWCFTANEPQPMRSRTEQGVTVNANDEDTENRGVHI
jgi:hypothetical protein